MPSAESERSPDVPVFIISIDTLRSDRLPVYGYDDGSTPAIDRFRRDAILFRNAFANAPLTLPSHASLFTGRMPYRHGVRDNIGYQLPREERTVGSILKAHGYATGAAVSSFVMRRDTGIAAGFDFYDDAMTVAPQETISSWQRDGDATRLALTTWLESSQSSRVFGFLHLYEPHMPYTPPEPFASRFEDPYDGEIAQADAIVGRFLDDLRARGLYDSALIVILSDHGEGLGDHGEAEHGVFLYREAIQVPLLMKLPHSDRAAEEIREVTSLTDLLPIILSRLRIPIPEDLDGLDLLSGDVPSGRSIYSESYYPRLHYGWSELFSQIDDRYHLIEAPTVELYDYRTDPGEKINIASENRRMVASLRRELEAAAGSGSFQSPAVSDPEEIRKLESLGYLGTTVPTASGSRPDPKDQVGLLTSFGRGAALLQQGRHGDAVRIGREIVATNPDFLQGWGLISSAYRSMGDLPRAIEALESQMERSPGNPQTALALASLTLEAARHREARTYAELAIPHMPTIAYETLAAIALAEGDPDAAEEAAKRAAAAGPLRVQPLMLESQVRHSRRDFAGELQLLDRVRARVAEQKLHPISELELRRGEALLQLGRTAEAEQAFRAEIESFPSHHRAWANLALVVGAQGRSSEARDLLDEAVRTNPDARMRQLARDALRVMKDAEEARRRGISGG